ncbi:MAG: NifB/NifX family molybdenum-iron cluster-binding protein [Smithellaceae bacterium]
MNICIPILADQGLNSPVSSHFGQAQAFAMINAETNAMTIIQNTGTHHGGTLTPAEIIGQAGADMVLCGGLGVKAVRLFEQQGIHVYCQASGTVADTLQAYKNGALPEATDANACQHHAH